MFDDSDYNKDQKRRNEIVFGKNNNLKESGGIISFDDLTLPKLKKLVKEKFADPDECQNSAPSIQEFVDWADDAIKSDPSIKNNLFFTGYVVDLKRSDYRVSIEGLTIKGPTTVTVRTKFMDKFRQADDFNLAYDTLSCWYD